MNPETLLRWIADYGMAAVFAMIALEYACFPVPSELVLPFAGAFAARTGTGFGALLAVSVAAGVTGSLACYLIGRLGGGALLARWSAAHPKAARGLEASREWFARNGDLSVAVGRVLPVCRTYISFVAGIAGQKPWRFVLFSAAGITVWNTVLMGLGYQLGSHWDTVSVWAEKYRAVLLPVALVAIVGVALHIRAQRKKPAPGSARKSAGGARRRKDSE